MRFIQFDRDISSLESFDTIGYDVQTEKLKVKFFDGSERTFDHVPEQKIFRWLLTEDKETYYHRIIRPMQEKKKAESL